MKVYLNGQYTGTINLDGRKARTLKVIRKDLKKTERINRM